MTAQRSRWFVVGLALMLVGSTSAAQKDDPFSAANAKPAAKTDPTAKLVRFEYFLAPATARRGETVRLTITGTPKPGYHTFPLTQRSEDPVQDPSGLNQLDFILPPGVKVLEPVIESDPQWVVERTGGVYLEFNKPFTWTVDLLVLPQARTGDLPVAFTVKLQVCDENQCVRGKQRFEASIHVSNDEAVALAPALLARLKQPQPEIKVVAIPAALRDKRSNHANVAPAAPEGMPGILQGEERPQVESVAVGEVSFLKQLLLAMGAGFIMLLTPCVFPMIPVTVSYFLKQGEKEHNSPLILALVYSGTIIVVLTVAVLVLGNVITSLANNVWLNLAMGLLLVVFALSLFGMFELELPGFLTRYTSAHEGTGYLGAFFMALTFTVNSFTCTGPFLGPLLTAVKELKMSRTQVFTSSLAYAVAFASPFFVLALFPRLLKSLPKSGGWLNGVKVVMAFLELALALKFFSIMDAGFFPGNPQLFNYETVLCTWIALAIACGFYLFGVFRLPHDSPVEHIGVPRLVIATMCFGLAVYMTPLLWRKAPLGAVGGVLISWLPQDSAPVDVAPTMAGNGNKDAAGAHLDWSRDYEKAWEEARAAKKLLFIDFTGTNCINCRFNETTVFPRPDVKAEMAKFVRVQLYTDVVPDRRLSRAMSLQEAERNWKWQENTFRDVSLPFYVVLDPAGASSPITEDGRLGGTIKETTAGTIHNVDAFVSLLKKASSRQLAFGK